MVHGHEQRGIAVALLGGFFHPVQMAGFFFIGFGMALEVMAVGVFGIGLARLQGIFEVLEFVFVVEVGQVAVAAELAQFNGHVEVRSGFVGVGFPAQPA